MTEEIRGLDLPALRPWLAEQVEGLEAPLRFELVAAGGSNLTYRVEDAAGRCLALRRPPLRSRIRTAHDMSREWRILEALHAHPEVGVPVPAPRAYCADPEVLGADFYLMDFAEGLILRGPEEAEGLDPKECRVATESLIDVQVAMHRLDPDAVGLGELGRRGSYVERQLSRWHKQFEAVKTRELPLLEALHARLGAAVPPQQGVGLVHGDYRFDNTVLGADHRVSAVLDWELCTLGDPVADFVWSMMYWSDPGEVGDFGSPSPTRQPNFPRRAEVVELYARRSGFDLSGFDYYVAFSWWKMACLVEGVVARLRAGAGGGMATSSPEQVMERVDSMLERAAEAAERV